MATKKRFDIGDEVSLHGIVRLLDAGGEGTVTIEVLASGTRLTVMADFDAYRFCSQGQGRAGFY